ncbi:hypothetical protein CC2G_004777 [Coprinopsis cinerea AmutBmut pab1-1]|nr:hypothetical protein CC2G_004777 [Coprinopsis cinerea AmutBmut pab1-1]
MDTYCCNCTSCSSPLLASILSDRCRIALGGVENYDIDHDIVIQIAAQEPDPNPVKVLVQITESDGSGRSRLCPTYWHLINPVSTEAVRTMYI